MATRTASSSSYQAGSTSPVTIRPTATRHADVILPPSGPLERDHYDLALHLLAVRNTARYTPAVLPKAEGSRHEWEIYQGLMRRYRRIAPVQEPLRSDLPTRVLAALSPARVVDLGLRAGPYKLSLRRLLRTPQGVDLGPLRPCLPDRLATADKRIDCVPELLLADLARARDSLDAPREPATLLLVGRRHLRSNNSWMHNTTRLSKGKPRHGMLMHPDDLAARGLADGDTVRVRSRVGSVEIAATASEDVMPGVVSIPHGFGHSADGTRQRVAAAIGGASVNDLTDPADLDAVAGTAVLNGVAVKIGRAHV